MELTYVGIPIIALIMGVLEVFKWAGVNTRFIPIISLVLSIPTGIFLFSDGDIFAGIVIGTFIGLSSVGLFSGTKNTLKK